MTVIILLLVIKAGVEDVYGGNLCTTNMFLILDSFGELITIIFFIIGIVVTYRIRKYRDTPQYAQ